MTHLPTTAPKTIKVFENGKVRYKSPNMERKVERLYYNIMEVCRMLGCTKKELILMCWSLNLQTGHDHQSNRKFKVSEFGRLAEIYDAYMKIERVKKKGPL